MIGNPKPKITSNQVRALFDLWNEALSTGDSGKVAELYTSSSPLLLPTVSDKPRTDFDGVKDYFDTFLKKQPKGKIVEGYIEIGSNGGWASDAGIYEFEMGVDNSVVRARYSFLYVKEDKVWKIKQHHSSMMPEGVVAPIKIAEEEVRSLFSVWNDALASLDPAKVADCYSKNAVLLPTLSDTPRTNNEGIIDYFTNFLKLEPQGEILSGDIIVGTNWAQDAGIYEFTMGKTGEQVKGRYTYVYIFEDGQWKISQHHSSLMPEASKENAITESDVKALFDLWNNALGTGNSSLVAHLYTSSPILLPTVSNKPRTDFDEVKDYFDTFLKKQPEGKIIESYINIGKNNDWATDVGIYEFTMGIDGSVVRARYSFLYVKEGASWKIQHHHSSAMPEK